MDFALEAHIDEFSYPRGAHPATRSVDLMVRRGEFLAVVGPAGAGKTTLCQCLAGVIPHFVTGTFHGSVKVDGRSLNELRLPEIAPLVGFVQQRPENQLFNLTVEEEVTFGPENLCLDPGEIRNRLDESLAFVGMKGFEPRSPDGLSGGEAQRIVLASILAMGPELFVLDQPVAELDPLGRKSVYANLCRLNSDGGATIVLVEDRLDDVLPFLTRVILMLDGRIAKDAPPNEFFADDALPSYGIRLPDAVKLRHPLRLIPSTGGQWWSTSPLPKPEACESRFGNAAAPWALGGDLTSDTRDADVRGPAPHRAAKTSAPYAEEVQNLGFRYSESGQWVLKGLSLGFRPGELTAVIGGNGAGKTTLAKQLAGLLRPTEGTVLIRGRDISRESTASLSIVVGFLFQDPDYQLFCNSVFDEVGFSLKIRKVPPRRIADLVDATLQKLGLLTVRDRHPYTLSRGQRQRLALASILVRGPEVLVVDEPSTGLDYRETIQMMELLGEFRTEGGTVVMITHDMEMVLRYADRSVVMAEGMVVLDAPTRNTHISERRNQGGREHS